MTTLSFGTDASRIVRPRTGASTGVVFTSVKPDCHSNMYKNRTLLVQNITLLKDQNRCPDQSTPVHADEPKGKT